MIGKDMDMNRIVTHPGEILREEYLVPYRMSANALARELAVPTNRVTAILNGTRGVTADTALRLGVYFDTTPEFWLNLQTNHDLSKARAETGDNITARVHRRVADVARA